jgi:hypothetical protein
MTSSISEALLNKNVVLRIAVPGEDIAQHNGRIAAIDDTTVTIINGVENSADILVTSYNLKYVVLIQYIQPTPVDAESTADAVESSVKDKPVTKKSK